MEVNGTIDGETFAKILIPIQIIVGIITAFGNFVVLIVTLRDKTLKKTTNILVGSLAFIDTTIGVFGTPVVIINMHYVLYAEEGWIKCVVLPVSYYPLLMNGLGIMCLIVIERYRAIVQFHKPPYTPKQVMLMILVVFISTLFMCLKFIIPYLLGTDCGDYDPKFTTTAVSVVAVWFLFGTLTVCYSKIIQKLRSQTAMKNNRHQQTRQAIYSFMACFLWYLIFFIPLTIVMLVTTTSNVYYGTNLSISPRGLYFYGLTYALVNSMVNPFIYGIFNKKIR